MIYLVFHLVRRHLSSIQCHRGGSWAVIGERDYNRGFSQMCEV